MTASTMTALASDYGLIFSSDRHRTGLGESVYLRAAQRGELVRVRRGVYCDAGHWAALSERDRYLLKIRATVQASAKPLVLCAYSAAAVWDMPILAAWPDEVHVISDPARGGRSKPGVRRHPVADSISYVEEQHGLLVTSVARTALDLALMSDFASAVGTLDWALWRRNPLRVKVEEVRRELERLNPRYRRSHASAVIDFATPLSDSFGESFTRAVIHELGYPAPELQVRFRDWQGVMDVDYFWRAQRKVGEYDGAAKYLRREYAGDLSPGEVVWREKKREDRLRRQGAGVIRIIWDDTRDRRRLDDLLRESGLRPSPRSLPTPRASNNGSGEPVTGARTAGASGTRGARELRGGWGAEARELWGGPPVVLSRD